MNPMAIVKHIKSRNANYSAAINYLLFEHDEKTGKKIVDESGRSILRKEFYMDGLNCDPMSFDKECELTNAHFHKNKKREDIKSHHYIISYDPADVTENGLTGERAGDNRGFAGIWYDSGVFGTSSGGVYAPGNDGGYAGTSTYTA